MDHTPGPWEVRELISDGFIIRKEGTYLIWTPDYDVATYVSGVGPFRKLADARLAAAAPDLLEALEHSTVALEYIAGELRELGEDGDADMMERQAQENRAVIAKARYENRHCRVRHRAWRGDRRV